MRADEQDASIAQDVEYVLSDAVAKWIDDGVCKRASDKIEGEIEVCQREVGEEEVDELVYEFNM